MEIEKPNNGATSPVKVRVPPLVSLLDGSGLRRLLCHIALLACCVAMTIAPVDAQSIGSNSGLPLPRFVSLKSKAVNLRVGPGRDYAVEWLYVRPGLPVEIVQEFDQWRRIRDVEGTEGWVFHSLLSGSRTAFVAPWEKPGEDGSKPEMVSGHVAASDDSAIAARIQPGALVRIIDCEKGWCRAFSDDLEFFLPQKTLWGVYPDESVKG